MGHGEPRGHHRAAGTLGASVVLGSAGNLRGGWNAGTEETAGGGEAGDGGGRRGRLRPERCELGAGRPRGPRGLRETPGRAALRRESRVPAGDPATPGSAERPSLSELPSSPWSASSGGKNGKTTPQKLPW